MGSVGHERVKGLFLKAVELPVAQRSAWLSQVCGDDAALRAQVEALLISDESASVFLDRPAFDADRTGSSPQGPAARTIGPFRICGVLGLGGMGIVYAAEQDHPRREVALKVVRSDVATPGARQRAVLEADILARLQHPAIAHVYEAGVADLGLGPQPYFAMELIRGVPVSEYAVRHTLGARERLELFAQVCDAVQYAHERGVVHRDLKPANILVDDAGRPKVLDFGVARVVSGEQTQPVVQTLTGQIVGTLAYMSPEQASGPPAAVDARSDVYALGVVLFELLSGRLPHDVRLVPLAEAARRICQEEPTRLGSVAAEFRGDLETIAAKALEKDRARRYPSVAALADDVRRYLRDEPIAARPPTVTYQLRKFARRHRGLVSGVLIAFVVLLAGIVAATTLALREARQRRLASASEQAARRMAYVAGLAAAGAALQQRDVRAARVALEQTPPEHRGWEWDYFHNRLNDDLATIAFDPDERLRRAFLETDGCTLVVYSTGPEGDFRRCHLGQEWKRTCGARECGLIAADVVEVARSPLSTAEAWRTRDGAVHVRSNGAAPPRTFQPADWGVPEPARIRGLQITDDGTRLAFLSLPPDSYNASTVWQVELASAKAASLDYVLGTDNLPLALRADGRVGIPSMARNEITLWDSETGDTAVLAGHQSVVEAVAYSPDGQRLASVSRDASVRLWDVRTATLMATGLGHQDYATHVAFSPDGAIVASTGQDLTVRLWSADSLAPLRVLTGHMGAIHSLSFSAEGRDLVTASADGTVRIWDTGPAEPGRVGEHDSYAYDVAVAPDASLIASAGWDGLVGKTGCVRLWEPGGARRPTEFDSEHGRAFSVTFSPDGAVLAVGTDAGLALLDATTGEVTRRHAVNGGVHDAAFSPDGRRIAAAWDGALHILDAVSGESVAAYKDAAGRVASVAWTRNGHLLACEFGEAEIGIWDVASGHRLAELRGHTGPIWDLAFSPDGALLASASLDDTVRLWHSPDWSAGAVLTGALDDVLAVAFHPDGTRLVSAGRDGLIRVWDLATGDCVAHLTGHKSYIKALAFSSDGRTLYSASGDQTIRAWSTVSPRVALQAP